jgi:hypothetical protein
MANATLNLATPAATTTLTVPLSATNTALTLTTLTLTAGPYTTVTASLPQWVLAIDGELMDVEAVLSSANLQLQVIRGTHGTDASAHGNGALCWAAPSNNFPDPAAFNSALSFSPRLAFATMQGIGQEAYSSLGNNTTLVAGTTYIASLYVNAGYVSTGLAPLVGGTGTTDNWTVYLYDNTLSNVLAYSAATTVGSGTNAFQKIAWTQQCFIGSGYYFIAVQSNGTHATLRTIAASTAVDVVTTSATGTAGTAQVVTIPTTFTANVGPIAYLY